MRAFLSCVAVSCLTLLACRAEAGKREIYRWKGDVGAAKVLRLRNLNGSITVERAPGAQAEVVVVAEWRGAEPPGLKVARAAGAAGLTFCALYPARGHVCEPDGRYDHQGDVQGNNLSLQFRVRVPAKTRLDLSTLNGSIDAEAAGADLAAKTLNGSIRAHLGPMPARASVSLQTTNGSIRIDAAAPLDADLDAATVNGSIRALGQRYRDQVQTKLGRGGLRLRAETVNGSIRVDAPSGKQSRLWNGCGGNPFQIGILRGLPCLPGTAPNAFA